MHLRLHHRTHTAYAPAVQEAWHMAFLQPQNAPGQRVESHSLEINPQPQNEQHLVDVFGNHALWFSQHQAHAATDVQAHCTLHMQAVDTVCPALAWEAVREHLRYQKGQVYSEATQYLHASPLVPLDDVFADHAATSFTSGRLISDACAHLCARIHTEFTYDPDSTHTHTLPAQALAQKSGVCQDFAHVFIACARKLGLAARYVSGYMLTQPPPGMPRLIGADASHAWASVFVPTANGLGLWLDCDPTNNRCGVESPGIDYIRLAIGRDYSDVPPLRGVIHGGQQQSQTVQVTVMPVEHNAAL